MATATARTSKPVIEEVTLTLSRAEAEAVFALTGRCLGGGALEPVYQALRKVGVSSIGYEVESKAYDTFGVWERSQTIRVRKTS